MADFAVQAQDYNRVTVTSASLESIGTEVLSLGGLFNNLALTWPVANRAIFVPFLVYTPLTVVKMFCSNGSTTSGNIDVGVYDTGGHRLVSSGSTAQSGASSVQAFDVTDTTLQPGVYFFGVAMDNTTATLSGYAPVNTFIAAAMGVLSMSTAFPLPDPAVFTAAADAYVPLVGITARTVI